MKWLKTRYCFHPPETAVAMLWKNGYRQISRKERTIARVDLTPEDFVEFFKNKQTMIGTIEGKMELYRRDYSPDKITLVPEPLMMLLRKREKQCVN